MTRADSTKIREQFKSGSKLSQVHLRFLKESELIFALNICQNKLILPRYSLILSSVTFLKDISLTYLPTWFNLSNNFESHAYVDLTELYYNANCHQWFGERKLYNSPSIYQSFFKRSLAAKINGCRKIT